MLTIHEVLLNAQINFENLERLNPGVKQSPIYWMAKNQLDNALKQLEDGGSVEAEFVEADDDPK